MQLTKTTRGIILLLAATIYGGSAWGTPSTPKSRYAPLIQKVKKQLRQRPKDPRLMTVLGRLYQREGRRSKAAYWYRRALKIRPGYAAALVGQGRLALEQQKVQRAQRLFRRVLRKNPRHAGALEGMGEVYRFHYLQARSRKKRQRFLKKAISFLEKAVQYAPRQHRMRYRLGLFYFGTREYFKAHVQFVQATAIAPHKACYRLALGLADAFLVRNIARSHRTISRWLPACTHRSVVRLGRRILVGLAIRLAQKQMAAGKSKQSIQLLRKTLRRVPRSATGHFFLALLLLQQGRCQAAQHALQRSLQLRPNYRAARRLSRDRLYLDCHKKTSPRRRPPPRSTKPPQARTRVEVLQVRPSPKRPRKRKRKRP